MIDKKILILILVFILTACSKNPETVPTDTTDHQISTEKIETFEPINWETKTIKFEHLSIENGLSQSVVNAIIQDHLGFMWFGTQDGLNRYDGKEIRIFKHDPDNPQSICDNFIQSLYEDNQGILWIGTFGGGLNRYDPKIEAFNCYLPDSENPQSISHPTVSQITQSTDGTFWLGTNGGGLNHFDPKTETFIAYKHNPDDPQSISSDIVLQVVIDQAGKIWVGTFDNGLNVFDPVSEKFERVTTFGNVQTLRLDQQGFLWVGSMAEGLAKINTTTREISYFPIEADNPSNPQDNNIH